MPSDVFNCLFVYKSEYVRNYELVRRYCVWLVGRVCFCRRSYEVFECDRTESIPMKAGI